MRFRSLKSKLLFSVSLLVVSSGLLISLLLTQRHTRSIQETMLSQAENLAHALALEAADLILIHDLVALQKMLQHQLRSHGAISYAFVVRDGEVLAHTFEQGFPSGLLHANPLEPGTPFQIRKVMSLKKERYLDIAWPVFEGKAGVIRLGFSEGFYRQEMKRLWLQIGVITLTILFLTVGVTLFFMSKITRPLAELTLATQRIDAGEPGVRVQVSGKDELGILAASFNAMVARMEEYTGKLESQAVELERAHNQTRTSCSIVREIGGMRGLKEIGADLIDRFGRMLGCNLTVLLIFSQNQTRFFTITAEGLHLHDGHETGASDLSAVKGIQEPIFVHELPFRPALVPEAFQEAVRYAIIPIRHESQSLGALVTACSDSCECSKEGIDSAGLILTQTGGVLKRALAQEEELRQLQDRLGSNAEFVGLVGKDPKMQVIYRLIEDIAPTDAAVLIQGESGTGKELVANAIHQKSSRKEGPFIVINCSAYPDTLLESELFGHEKGAFTGAMRQKAGRFEQADGGTVFLDEIGEIPPSAQIKLLRVLQSHQFERLGGEHIVTVDVRIISATNKDLLNEVKNGRFREDLFYRLNVIPMNMPPLKDRRNDIPLLAHLFARRFAGEQNKTIDGISEDAMRLLLDHSWPGNVRELKNSIEHAAVLAKGERIEASDLPAGLGSPPCREQPSGQPTLVRHERELLTHTLEECGWNKKEAARRLGISRNTLYVKIKKYRIEPGTTL